MTANLIELSDLKLDLGIEGTDEDALLNRYISIASSMRVIGRGWKTSWPR